MIETQPQRRRQVMEEVTAHVGDGVAQGFGAAVPAGQQIRGVKSLSLVNEAGAVRAVLGRKGDGRIGEMVQFGQGGKDVGLLRPGHGRIIGSATKDERGDLRISMTHLLEHAPQGIAEVGQKATAAAAGCTNYIDARYIVAQGQTGFADSAVKGVWVGCLLYLTFQPGQQAEVIVRKCQPAQRA